VLGLIIDAKKALNVCVNINESGMMIKKYLEIAQNMTGRPTLVMPLGISVLYGKMRIALSSMIQGLKDFMLGKRM
jgi:hypothetical protein